MSNLTAMQVSNRKVKTVLFVDKAAELSTEDKSTLEDLGYTVVILNGDPGRMLYVQTIPQGA